jgi:DNA polymerase V
MTGAGIHSGDILIVDRSLTPATGRVVIAVVDGEFLVRRIAARQGKQCLVAENDNYRPIEFDSDREVEMWGVATYVIHALGVPTGK